MQESLGFLWQECPGGVCLLKVYGDTPCPVVPDTIDGLPVREIGAYCFAEKEVPHGKLSLPERMSPQSLHPICGNFVQEVILPDSVHLLDSAAFYNCRSLHRLEVGAGIDALGSDLFTNCRVLDCIAVRSAPDSATGLRKLVGSVSADVSAQFVGTDGMVTAKLFYPEYFELLDENTPAHIFNHSIEGEGYRYRQCFDGGVLQFAEYDAIYPQACVGESAEKLCRLALERLRWPFALGDTARERYQAYVTAHLVEACRPLIAARDLAALRFVRSLPSLPQESLTRVAEACGASGFGPGAALFVSGHRSSWHKTYNFDDI